MPDLLPGSGPSAANPAAAEFAAAVTLRRMQAGAGEVADLITEVIAATYPAELVQPTTEKTLAPERLQKILAGRSWFEARDVDSGVLLGVAAVHLEHAGSAYLSCHFVRARRRGLGRALLRLRLAWAAHEGATVAVATTHPWNTASLANLRSAGFVVTDESPDRWAGEGTVLTLRASL